ncbi:MAG: alkaline phosphatase family protein, partial [Verrucomicrobiae bacterium]|nr:alkaline phosphatase family protein [Verrucomicrobiae bacterium]
DDMAGEGQLEGEKTSTFPHKVFPSKKEGLETIIPTPFGNQLLLEFAMAAIDGENLGQGPEPDVLCVSFSSIDYCGHKFGPYSHEVQDMTLRLDRQIADFVKFLDKKIGLANVVLLLTSDHGVAPTPEFAIAQGLDGKRINESEVVDDLLGKMKERFGTTELLLTPRIVGDNFFFNHEVLREKQISPDTLCDFISEWALSTGLYLEVYSRKELLEGRAPGPIGMRVMNGFNAERSGDIVLVSKPYAIPGDKNSGTTHGSPYAYDTHVPVAFYGVPFKAGRYADDFSVTDIAATLCAAMHINPPPLCMGKPLVRALALP